MGWGILRVLSICSHNLTDWSSGAWQEGQFNIKTGGYRFSLHCMGSKIRQGAFYHQHYSGIVQFELSSPSMYTDFIRF